MSSMSECLYPHIGQNLGAPPSSTNTIVTDSHSSHSILYSFSTASFAFSCSVPKSFHNLHSLIVVISTPFRNLFFSSAATNTNVIGQSTDRSTWGDIIRSRFHMHRLHMRPPREYLHLYILSL